MRKTLRSGLLFLIMMLHLTGCTAGWLVAGGLAGAGGVVWVKGKLTETLDHPLPVVHTATIQALKGVQVPVEKDVSDHLTARIESRFADGKRLWIDLDSLSETSTRISIRIGLLGDKERSHRLLRAIHRHLP